MNFCPSVFELTSGELLAPQLAAHVAACPRCRDIRAAWEANPTEVGSHALDEIAEITWPHPVYDAFDADPVPGALHSIWGAEDGRLLVAAVLEVDDREALVVPVSDQPELAGDWDLLLGDAVLPYPAMLEVWNHLRVLREQLMEQVARLDDGWLAGLRQAYISFMYGDSWPEGYRQGPALLGENDPRFRFRDTEAGRVRGFAEPWRILFSADTLGGVLSARRQESELDVTQLGEEVDLDPAALQRLEADQEDIHQRVPKAKLIRLIKRLQLPASARVVDLVEAAVAATVTEPPAGQAVARARRRQGVRSGRPTLSKDERRAIAQRYVSGLLENLRD